MQSPQTKCSKDVAMLHEKSRLEFCVSWISEASSKSFQVDSSELLYSLIENLRTPQELQETNEEKKVDEVKALMCLIAASPHLPDINKLCQDLLHLSQLGIFDKMLLYLAFAARSNTDGLFTLADEEKQFWGNNESFLLGLVERKGHLLLELLLFSLKKETHWLTFLLEVICQLLRENCVGPVKMLLSHPTLKHIRPIVLLHLIQNEASPSSLKFAIDCCLELENIDPSIRKLAEYLKWQLKVLSLAEHGLGSLCISGNLYKKNLSPLSFLYNTCDPLYLGWEITNQLLLECSWIDSTEIAVHSAYWAFMLCLQSIIASCYRIKSSSVQYNENVANNLMKVETILCQLQPLDLRVEIIEKIFSLLFLRYEDLQMDVDSDSDNGEDETSLPANLEESMKLRHCDDFLSSLTTIVETDTHLKQKIRSSTNNKASVNGNWLCPFLSELPKHGFVCERHVTRDLLKMLQHCLNNIEEISAESDSKCNLNERVNRITSYVSEGLWRLEILTSAEFVENANRDLNAEERPLVPSFRGRFSWYSVDNDDTSDDEDSFRKNAFHGHRRSDPEKSSESGSQSNVTCSTNGPANKANRSSRRKSSSRTCSRNLKDTIIKRMLSSETSLIAQCILSGDIYAAKQTLQKLKLEESEISNELSFAEAYHKLQSKLDCFAQEENKDGDFPLISTLRAIQKAASAGVQASSLNIEVEALLKNSPLPSVPNVKDLPSDFLHMIGGPPDEQAVAIIGTDVALMLSSSAQQALNFLSIASKHCQELRNVHLSGLYRSPALGFLPFVQNIFQAISLNDSESPTALLHRWDVPGFLNRHLKDSLQFLEAVKLTLCDMDASQNVMVLYPKLQNLLSACASFKAVEGKYEYNYLQEFKTYLKSLLHILKHKSAVMSVDGPLSEEHVALLKDSPTRLICNMMCENKILPQDLEPIVSDFGSSLLPILCAELCSSLPSIPPAKTTIEVHIHKLWLGAYILNTSEDIGPPRSPTDAVYKLLHSVMTELQHELQVEQNVRCSKSGSLSLSCVDTEKMLSLLSATWELSQVDLNLLTPGAETLSFYCNLATLMWIHSVVFLQSIGGKGLYPLFQGSPFHQTVALNSLAYQVGNLGVLTLWDVRRLAVSGDLMLPIGTEALCQHAFRTDSCDPFALFVVPAGSQCSPKIQLLQHENLETQLQQSVQEYLDAWVRIVTNEIFVPRVVTLYIQYTGQNVYTFLLNNSSDLLKKQLNASSDNAVVSYFDEPNIENCITISYNQPAKKVVLEECQEEVSSKAFSALDKNEIDYIKQNFPLGEILIRNIFSYSLNNEELEDKLDKAVELDEAAMQTGLLCLDRLCKTLEVDMRSHFYDNNALLGALHDIVPERLLWKNLDHLVEEKNWQAIVDVLGALPELQYLGDHLLGIAKDLALMELCVKSRGFGEPWKYCERISSIFLRARLVIGECFHWSVNVCLVQLQKLLQIPQLRNFHVLHERVSQLKHSIKTYGEILNLETNAEWKSWQEVRELSLSVPETVLPQILSHGNAQLCYSWIKLHNVPSCQPDLMDNRVITKLLNSDPPLAQEAEYLLCQFPHEISSKICLRALHEITSISGVQFCIRFLSDVCVDELTLRDRETVKLALFGVQMMEMMNKAEQQECLELMSKPHLILEQLVMNMRLETAERILRRIGPELESIGLQLPLAIPAIDSMLRQYAEKALEFRIAQGSSASLLSENSCLLTSVSSLSVSTDFVMPLIPPVKNAWVPNEQASLCMNCQITTFSMFNRRHHCRRCGRVVCAQCSSQRMNVEGYGMQVRVCSSCYSQTQLLKDAKVFEQNTVLPSSRDSIFSEHMWRLTHSPELNDTVREEFSYENAPSVSLCLSILNLHSESAACPNFLVDSCETMLKYLQPQGGIPNPEIDYGLVIDMCRSLVLAAKVKCAQWGYVSDEPSCDQRLSKIDLIGLLVSHGCIALIPNETSSHGLRRLQAQLLEEELWELALEVSTKGGMERIGVWSAWGKGCLRAGRWEDARDKFAHCFPHKRSASNPPLLLEILQILEGTYYSMDKEVLQKAESLKSISGRLAPSPAVAVLHSLASLKSISQGKFPKIGGAKGSLDPLVYAECRYYLQKYGSHSSYLKFLVRHSDLKEALIHALDNSVDPQLFFEWVYMPCLKMGRITPLHTSMTEMDSSLRLWKPYLHGICAALERRSQLHTLYEVQQWSKDHVRAAMTCIRFYCQKARSYSDLFLNINHLMHAQSHLEAAHAVSTLPSRENKSGNGSSNTSSNSGAEMHDLDPIALQLTSKELDHHLSTIWLQIEITKFLKNCEVQLQLAQQWFPQSFAAPLVHGLPTLFGNTSQRKILAALCIICGKNVEEGFGISYRIIVGLNINAHDVYEAVAVALCCSGRISEVQQLINCIQSCGISDHKQVCDSVLFACINNVTDKADSQHLDVIIRSISDPVLKISAFIKSGQLKSAYLLAVKLQRLGDIERILEEADRSGQTSIKNICLKRLGRL